MNFEIWFMYILWNLPSSPVLSLSKFSSNVKTVLATEVRISTAYCSLQNEMERNETERNEMKICSLRNENL